MIDTPGSIFSRPY